MNMILPDFKPNGQAVSQDPLNFRRDGKRRTGVGRFLFKAAPVAGRVLKGIALGVVDGIPGVSQVVNTKLANKQVNGFSQPARIVMGWSTVVLFGMTFAAKMHGDIDGLTLLAILRMLFGY